MEPIALISMAMIATTTVVTIIKFADSFQMRLDQIPKEKKVGKIPGVSHQEFERHQSGQKMFPDRHPRLHRLLWRNSPSYRQRQLRIYEEREALHRKIAPLLPKTQKSPPRPPARTLAPCPKIRTESEWQRDEMRNEARERYGLVQKIEEANPGWLSRVDTDRLDFKRTPYGDDLRAMFEQEHPERERCDNRSVDKSWQCPNPATLEVVKKGERIGVYSCDDCSKQFPKLWFWKINKDEPAPRIQPSPARVERY